MESSSGSSSYDDEENSIIDAVMKLNNIQTTITEETRSSKNPNTNASPKPTNTTPQHSESFMRRKAASFVDDRILSSFGNTNNNSNNKTMPIPSSSNNSNTNNDESATNAPAIIFSSSLPNHLAFNTDLNNNNNNNNNNNKNNSNNNSTRASKNNGNENGNNAVNAYLKPNSIRIKSKKKYTFTLEERNSEDSVDYSFQLDSPSAAASGSASGGGAAASHTSSVKRGPLKSSYYHRDEVPNQVYVKVVEVKGLTASVIYSKCLNTSLLNAYYSPYLILFRYDNLMIIRLYFSICYNYNHRSNLLRFAGGSPSTVNQ